MTPWKSFAFVTSKIQCKRRKRKLLTLRASRSKSSFFADLASEDYVGKGKCVPVCGSGIFQEILDKFED